MIKSTRKNQVVWGRTHLPCPCPKKEQRCFAEFAGTNGRFGKCFACGEVVKPTASKTKNCHFAKMPAFQRDKVFGRKESHKLIPRSTVEITTSALERVCLEVGISNEYSADQERAAILEFEAGLSRAQAEIQSAVFRNERERAFRVAEQLQSLCPFAAFVTRVSENSMLACHWEIGLVAKRAALFWYRNKDAQFVNAKVIVFENDGERRRQDTPPYFLYRADQGYSSDCFYGEHQLHPDFRQWNGIRYSRTSEIIIVESEKSAILASYCWPDRIWLACGGANGVTRAKAEALRGRTVKLMMDKDEAGRKGSLSARSNLLAGGAAVGIIDVGRQFTDRSEGWDIADEIVLQYKNKLAKR